MTSERYVFGTFDLSTTRRDLRCEGRAVDIGSRAFDLLVALLRRAGRVVSKAELLCEVWPGITVEPNNLEVYVSILRKLFESSTWSAGPIVTVRGRGYCFVEPVRFLTDEAAADTGGQPKEKSLSRRLGLARPFERPSSPLIGRDDALVLIRDRLIADRFVTLTGAGGVGKTRLAREVGARLAGGVGDVRVVDFAEATTARAALDLLADELQIAAAGGIIDAAACAETIGETRLLMIFETCEHIFETIALIANYLMGHCPNVLLLATSRRRLGVPSEIVIEVTPLAAPSSSRDIAAEEVMAFPAVALFADRAAAVAGHFKLTSANAIEIGLLCAQLDGLPLAIELAVPLLKVLTPSALARCVERRAQVLVNANRAAPPRHRTLRDIVAWSFAGLSRREEALMRALSIFKGPVTFQTMLDVVVEDETDQDDVLLLLFELVEKSLLAADTSRPDTRFAMSGVVRRYGYSSLPELSRRALHERLATHLTKRLQEAGDAWERVATRAWLAQYDDVRQEIETALAWSFGPEGDPRIALELAGLSHPLWHAARDPRGAPDWIEKAVALIDETTEPALRARLMSWPMDSDIEASARRLLAAASFYEGIGNAFEEGRCLAWAGERLLSIDGADSERHSTRALDLLIRFGRTKSLARCLRALASARQAAGDIVGAHDFTRRAAFISEAMGEATDMAPLDTRLAASAT